MKQAIFVQFFLFSLCFFASSVNASEIKGSVAKLMELFVSSPKQTPGPENLLLLVVTVGVRFVQAHPGVTAAFVIGGVTVYFGPKIIRYVSRQWCGHEEHENSGRSIKIKKEKKGDSKKKLIDSESDSSFELDSESNDGDEVPQQNEENGIEKNSEVNFEVKEIKEKLEETENLSKSENIKFLPEVNRAKKIKEAFEKSNQTKLQVPGLPYDKKK
jgi:hypothetical protein